VARAEDALSTEQQDLTDLYEAADALEIEAKEKQLALLLVNLDAAEQELAELLSGPDTLEVDSKQRQADLAEADLAKAEEDLDELVAGADPVELSAKQQQVEVARAALTQAEEDLDEIRNSPDPLEIALRETEVASSRVALSDAETDMANAILTAPMDGVVSVINVEAGSLINPNTPVLEVVDPTVVEVDGIVDEIDVLFVRVGASATVTMDALAGQVLDGVVSDVGSAARNQQGVVSYPIRIQVQVPAGITLPEGLSAVAGVVIREDRDVLLVPLQALYGTFDQPLVRVISAGVIEERPVVLGNSDDFWAVVQGGLAEGEQLVMQAEQASTTGFGFGGGFRPGGGFGGGGFGGGRPTGVGGR
jgi:HlyD family secretion protein